MSTILDDTQTEPSSLYGERNTIRQHRHYRIRTIASASDGGECFVTDETMQHFRQSFSDIHAMASSTAEDAPNIGYPEWNGKNNSPIVRVYREDGSSYWAWSQYSFEVGSEYVS